jgi:phage shock protein A
MEDPQTMLNLAIRDMEDEISALDKRSLTLKDKALAMKRQGDQIVLKLSECKKQITQSFEADNDTLGRHFVRQKLTFEAHQKQLTDRQHVIDQQIADATKKQAQYTLQLEEIKTQVNTLCPNTTDDYPSVKQQPAATVDTCDVEITFLTLKSQWQKQQEARSSAPAGGEQDKTDQYKKGIQS